MGNVAISIKNVSKRYVIGKAKDGSLRGTLSSLFSKSDIKTEEFWALKDVSFDIQKGDVIGIIGKNGAGKSTLLKILSQITKPTEGEIEINGRIASLLEVGTGFHPELTGRENIFLNGTILGMTRKEVASKFDEIVAFSGIEKFIDTPVKHYSSGMYVRLAFAVAAHLEPEILIIDEVLAVGDAEFQKKCLGKMKDVAGEGRTVIFVSHDLGAVKTLCNRGIYLSNGTVSLDGTTSAAIDAYNLKQLEANDFINPSIDTNKDFDLNAVLIEDENGKSKHLFKVSEPIHLNFSFFIRENPAPFDVYICIKNINGNKVFALDKKIKSTEHKLIIEPFCLTRGYYTIELFIQLSSYGRIVVFNEITKFEVIDEESELAKHGEWDYGSTFGKYTWL